jgi:hypothetical protein
MGDNSGDDWMGSEREVLLHYLNKMRDAVVRTSEGLTEEQQRTPGTPTSCGSGSTARPDCEARPPISLWGGWRS